MERKHGIEKGTLAGYPGVVRQAAREDNAAIIDLHAMGKVFYRALGGNLDEVFQDGTDHNNYGSYEPAPCVVPGIRGNKLDLAQHLADDFQMIDSETTIPRSCS
jgi:hypothetical protein